MLLDVTDADTIQDPFPLFARLQDDDPVHRTAQGVLALTRHEDCHRALRDPDMGKNDFPFEFLGAFPGSVIARHMREWMPFKDGAEHSRVRAPLASSFSMHGIAELRPMVEALADRLIEEMREHEEVELRAAFAHDLPAAVISHLVGVPQADRDHLHTKIETFELLFELPLSDELLRRMNDDIIAVEAYFADLLAERRRRPGTDLVSSMLAAAVDAPISDYDIITNIALLYQAGMETTTALLMNGMLSLLRNPDQLALLRDDPGIAKGAVEELLRFDGQSTMTLRNTNALTTFSGVEVGAGEQLMVLLTAGNRDPRRFAEPDRLDLRRNPRQVLSFGGGPHLCIGAALARMEAAQSFPRLLAAFPGMELVTTEPHYSQFALRRPDQLRVRLA